MEQRDRGVGVGMTNEEIRAAVEGALAGEALRLYMEEYDADHEDHYTRSRIRRHNTRRRHAKPDGSPLMIYVDGGADDERSESCPACKELGGTIMTLGEFMATGNMPGMRCHDGEMCNCVLMPMDRDDSGRV